ncbi:uncharacterized protein LOC114525515 [Dendronephthya gigantea]|uniref:uncharacterized protein LOC114525515 n=1 Tax=Dendronephthya gigantea TaxID=151771 RepID=UPI00106B33C5|nr:uncharacterized protein LOC114525515 [Dendronephthya gigantea]
MVMSVAKASTVIGCCQLLMTLVLLMCGSVAMANFENRFEASIGLWGFYFIIPAGLGIWAGYKKSTRGLVVALGTHLLGIIIALVGMTITGVFLSILASDCYQDTSQSSLHGSNFIDIVMTSDDEECTCLYDSHPYTYPLPCSDLAVVRKATAGVTIAFVIITIISLVGSINGCLGTCCAPEQPATVVVTAGNVQPGGPILMVATAPCEFIQQPVHGEYKKLPVHGDSIQHSVPSGHMEYLARPV